MVDRGGLCKLSDHGLELFCCIERCTYKLLKNSFSKKEKKNTDEICMVTIEDAAVWSIISIDMFEESEGKLLKRILSLNGLQ